MKDEKKKSANPYKVRTVNKSVKDVDLEKRTVTGIFNSAFYIDSDLDMLLPGAATKSISERGVGSTSGNKIKHLKDHDWSKNIARLDVLDERKVEINGKEVNGIYHESYYPESQDSTDLLIKIQEGLYDARSIGFQYEKMVYCAKESDNVDALTNWGLYLPMALNPEKAEEAGYFWVVKEIRLWEGSDVSFGANELTPMLGVKGATKDMLIRQVYDKLDAATRLMKDGKLSDEGFHRLEMEMKQIKSYIATLTDAKPPKVSTPEIESRPPVSTSGADFFKALTKTK
jgi:phage head maturation protease